MARIFITGSADGLGQMAANLLISQGHKVVLHARNKERGETAMKNAPGAETVVTGDLSDIKETIQLAEKVNELGQFDAIIHNAGVFYASPKDIFKINTLAPYILTCLIKKPRRLIFLSSKLHLNGQMKLNNFNANVDAINYNDSKLHVLLLTKAVARRWPDVYVNAVHPGWVPTKLGGTSATDSLEKGFETQSWLAVSDEAQAKVTGRYFFHQSESKYKPEADDTKLQDAFLELCQEITGVSL